MTSIELENKRKRIDMVVKGLSLLAIGFVAAPIVLVAIPGLLGLVATALIGVTAVNVAPVVSAKIANWRLKALKAEAMKSPVETLQNDYRSRLENLGKFNESIKTFSAKVQSFADRVETFKTQYPEEVEKFANQLTKMKQLLLLRQTKYRDAKRELERYEEEIKKAGAIWEMGQAAAEMTKAAGMTEGDFYAKIMVETAINSVQENMNRAFAELETSLIDEEEEASKRTGAQLKNQVDNLTRSMNNEAARSASPAAGTGNQTLTR